MEKPGTTTGVASKGKPVSPGVLYVDDSAAKARRKLAQEMAASQRKADAVSAERKAKYAAQGATFYAEQKARIAEEARKRKARGNRQ